MRIAFVTVIVLVFLGVFRARLFSPVRPNPGSELNSFALPNGQSNESVEEQRKKYLAQLHEQFSASKAMASATFRPQIVGGAQALPRHDPMASCSGYDPFWMAILRWFYHRHKLGADCRPLRK